MAVCIYAIPPIVRLTNLGIRLVDKDVMEAADAFGASAREKLFGVQIPLALPNIFAGVNQTIMMALSMVVIASMISVGGLGLMVLRGIGRPDDFYHRRRCHFLCAEAFIGWLFGIRGHALVELAKR